MKLGTIEERIRLRNQADAFKQLNRPTMGIAVSLVFSLLDQLDEYDALFEQSNQSEMKPETIKAIIRAKAYVHYKRLEADQSEDNQAMAEDLDLILKEIPQKRDFLPEKTHKNVGNESNQTFPSQDSFYQFLGNFLHTKNRVPTLDDAYDWLKEKVSKND